MTLEEGLYAYLKDVANLKALIADRLYPGVMPQAGATPAVVYTRVSSVREHTMGDDPGLASPRVQLSCYAQTYAGAKSVAAEVRRALQNQRDVTWGGVGGVKVHAVLVENEADMPWEPDTRLYCTILDFIIWHEE